MVAMVAISVSTFDKNVEIVTAFEYDRCSFCILSHGNCDYSDFLVDCNFRLVVNHENFEFSCSFGG